MTMKPSNAPPATKIHLIDPSNSSANLATVYNAWRSHTGRTQIPGILQCFGARPDFLQQVIDFSNTVHFSEGHLTRRHKEMLASYVSYLNQCPY